MKVIYLTAFLSIMVISLLASERPRSGRVFISDDRVQSIRLRIDLGVEPTTSAFKALEQFVGQNIHRTPQVPQQWFVPFYYENPEGHRKAKESLQDDANAAYGLALYFRLTGRVEAADKALEIINAWARGIRSFRKDEDSMLSFSYHFPALIFAADLLRGRSDWPDEDQARFAEFLRSGALPMSTIDRANNWGNWGLVLTTAIAAYLEDDSLLSVAANRWKEFIDSQIAKDGHLPHEVKCNGGKSGIWYSHFCLFPQTIAAEILKRNGVDLYDYRSPGGRTLESAFHKIAWWTTHPQEFDYWDGPVEQLGGTTYYSYFEILNQLWPDEHAAAGLANTRPQTANHSAPFLTLTHGGF